MVRSKSASVRSSRPRRSATPALLTSTSMGPSPLSTAFSMVATSPPLETSARATMDRRPKARAASATPWASLVRSRQLTATSAPAAASARAIALPMPREAPVTSATRPERSTGLPMLASSARIAATAFASGEGIIGIEPLSAGQALPRKAGLRGQGRGVRLRSGGARWRLADGGRHRRAEADLHARPGAAGRRPHGRLRRGLAGRARVAARARPRERSAGEEAVPPAGLRPARRCSRRARSRCWSSRCRGGRGAMPSAARGSSTSTAAAAAIRRPAAARASRS